MKKILEKNGFHNIKIKSWHVFRPLVTFWLKFHEMKNENDLSFFQKAAFRAAITIDGILQKILPSRLLSSIAIICYK